MFCAIWPLFNVWRGQAIALVMQGQRQIHVARHFDVQVCIMRLVTGLREIGQVGDRPRSGSTHVTSQHQDRLLNLPFIMNIHNHPFHAKTFRKRLWKIGLRARHACVGLSLTAASRQRRMVWMTTIEAVKAGLDYW